MKIGNLVHILCQSLLNIVAGPGLSCCILYSEHPLPSRDRSKWQSTMRKRNWEGCQRLAFCHIWVSVGNAGPTPAGGMSWL